MHAFHRVHIQRCLRCAVAHKLKRGHKPFAAAHIADHIVFFFKLLHPLIKLRAARSGVGFGIKPQGFRQAGGDSCCAHRMRRIGIAVENAAIRRTVVFKHLGDLIAHQRCAHRKIGAGDAFGQTHHIRLDPPMARAAPIAGAAETGDHFIRNHQNPVEGADIAHQPHE